MFEFGTLPGDPLFKMLARVRRHRTLVILPLDVAEHVQRFALVFGQLVRRNMGEFGGRFLDVVVFQLAVTAAAQPEPFGCGTLRAPTRGRSGVSSEPDRAAICHAQRPACCAGICASPDQSREHECERDETQRVSPSHYEPAKKPQKKQKQRKFENACEFPLVISNPGAQAKRGCAERDRQRWR